MTVREAKEMDMVDYLFKLGYEPYEIKGHNYWYLSPLRTEKTPSFKVNRKMNRWYDWGEGKGGNLVDFGVIYHKCSVGELLKKLGGLSLTGSKITADHSDHSAKEQSEADPKSQINIVAVRPIASMPLLRYLQKRRIAQEIADQFCKEIGYKLNGKSYYAIGFKNDAGGYELRNEYIKAASSPKDITFIDNGAKELTTFEGFFNFLSYRTMYHKQELPVTNFLILNSTSFFERSLPLMQQHRKVCLFLDNDKTGQKFTDMAIGLDREKFQDGRKLYEKYADLNDMLMNIGKVQKQRINLKQ